MSRTPKPTPEAQSTDAFDQGRDGERIAAYKLKCAQRVLPSDRDVSEIPSEKAGGGPRGTGEYARLTAKDREPRPGDARRWAAAIEASHHLPDGTFVSENDTNEPKLDETAIIIQNKEPVGVVANSGVDSGLDKPAEQPGMAEGNEALRTRKPSKAASPIAPAKAGRSNNRRLSQEHNWFIRRMRAA